MRARKLAFDAGTFEEYEQKYVSQISFPASSKSISSRRTHHIVPSRSTHDKENSFSGNSPSTPSKRKNPWADFDFATSSKKLSFEESFDENGSISLDQVMPLKKHNCPIMKRFMVMGTNEADKHSLIDSIFGLGDGELPHKPSNQSMDLIMKSESGDDYDIKYQFWMSNLDNRRFEDVVKVYYRCSSVFFFVYSIANRKSFEVLEEAIQGVLREVSNEKFVGVLIGNKNEMEANREVSSTEAASLKEKYGLKYFMEIDCDDETLKAKFQGLVR